MEQGKKEEGRKAGKGALVSGYIPMTTLGAKDLLCLAVLDPAPLACTHIAQSL